MEMRKRGITDPDSQEGIDCCLNCRLNNCELELHIDSRKLPGGVIYNRERQTRQLYREGVNVREIAKLLGISARTVQRYLR